MADPKISLRDAKHGNLHGNFAGVAHHDYINSSPGGHVMEAALKKQAQVPRPHDRTIPFADKLNMADKVDYSMSHGFSRYSREVNPAVEHRRYIRLAHMLDSQVQSGDLRGFTRPYVPPPIGNPAIYKTARKAGAKPMKAINKS